MKTLNQTHRYVLRLFIDGYGTNSSIAMASLERLKANHPEKEFVIEVVDLDINPELALEQGVFLSPALQILEPKGGFVYGNLSSEGLLEKILKL